MINIRMIAKKANVSIATVSRYINGIKVSDDSKARIEKVLEEVDYVPNQLAKAIFSKKSNVLGLIVYDITNPFFPEYSQLIEYYARQKGYSIIFANVASAKNDDEVIDKMLALRVDGIIVLSSRQNPRYSSLNIPVVSGEIEIPNKSYIITNHYIGGKLAYEILKDFSCEKIGLLVPKTCLETISKRLQGFMDQNENIKKLYLNEDESNLEELILSSDVDGLFVYKDILAMKACNIIAEHSLNIEIVGYDNISMLRDLYFRFSTIAQPIDEMAKLIVEHITDLSENNCDSLCVKLEPTKIIRKR